MDDDVIVIQHQIVPWKQFRVDRDAEELKMEYALYEIPPEVKQLSKLQCLYLRGNRIRVIENTPESLVELYMAKNELTELSLRDAPNVEILDVHGNHITHIAHPPPPSLHTLDISYNPVASWDNLGDNITHLDATCVQERIPEERLPRYLQHIKHTYYNGDAFDEAFDDISGYSNTALLRERGKERMAHDVKKLFEVEYMRSVLVAKRLITL